MDEHEINELAQEARYAAEATETCHLCGNPSHPVEQHIHTDCANYEQFLADQQ